MKTNAAALEIIKRNEGLRLHAYRDVVGIWTIGYGDTGPDVVPGLAISKEEAERRLVMRLADEFEPGVKRAIGDAPTTENQFGAMVSLAYNIGVGRLDNPNTAKDEGTGFSGSTVAEMHRAGNHQAAAEAFGLWVKADGKVYAGLVRRRGEEAELYLRPDAPSAERAASEHAIDAAIRDFEGKARSLQMQLKAGGYYQGKIDADWGPQSRQALADYQARVNQT